PTSLRTSASEPSKSASKSSSAGSKRARNSRSSMSGRKTNGAGARSEEHTTALPISDLIADIRKRTKQVSLEELKRRIEAREKLTLLDVREKDEWRGG